MRRWTRWQDWVALVAGVYAFLSPIWTATEMAATWSMIVLGVLLAVNALWSLMAPGAVASEWIHAVLGVLFVISPWVMAFSVLSMMSWTAWIVGIVALATGIWAIPYSSRAHRGDGAVPQA